MSVDLNYYDMFDANNIHLPKQRYQANARERYRTHRYQQTVCLFVNAIKVRHKIVVPILLMKAFFWVCYSVNSAFLSLRNLIPTEPKNRKLSKIETLRLATSYIEHLGAILLTGKPKCFFLHLKNYGKCTLKSNNTFYLITLNIK